MSRLQANVVCTPARSARTLQNARDLGGLSVGLRGRIRAGALYRSDAPLPGDAPPAVPAWPPRTVIDLRAPDELAGSHPLAGPATEVISVSLSAQAAISHMLAAPSTLRGELASIYRQLVEASTLELVHIAQLVAERPYPVLVHCTAGKDRTGIAIALILRAVGVPRHEVIADYRLTGARMPGVLDRVAEAPGEILGAPAMARRLAAERPWLLETPQDAIEAALHHLEGATGDSGEWLLKHGMTAGQLRLLRERLARHS